MRLKLIFTKMLLVFYNACSGVHTGYKMITWPQRLINPSHLFSEAPSQTLTTQAYTIGNCWPFTSVNVIILPRTSGLSGTLRTVCDRCSEGRGVAHMPLTQRCAVLSDMTIVSPKLKFSNPHFRGHANHHRLLSRILLLHDMRLSEVTGLSVKNQETHSKMHRYLWTRP